MVNDSQIGTPEMITDSELAEFDTRAATFKKESKQWVSSEV